ncbi:MAG TPA: HupE/UreJ family protein [Gammaproteobacteria bacterium]|nr:HupE/UreJ family protein [Gammaproteobacteria bacterium]
MQTINRTLALVGLMLLAPVASAHTFGAHGAGFAAGLVHPLIGLDHLLALIGAGLWAGWLGGRAQYQLPGGFLAGMLGGALLAWGGFNLPLVEPMIAVSVLLIGVLAASAARPSAVIGSALLFAFALFHGYAHGTELPQTAQPALYVMGFLLTSALVLLVAARLSIGLRSGRLSAFVRIAGGAVAAVGGGWLVGG